MADISSKSSTQPKKLLENPLVGSLVVPIAIILVGAAIIFGVTKMLSTERSYKDLVREMHSKTFGNRWIAAYELSKLISTEQIPQADIAWLVENLSDIYHQTTDERTKEFLVVAAGALKSPLATSLIEDALDSKNSSIQFHAIVALGNLPREGARAWQVRVLNFLKSEDDALKQAAILTLATHRIEAATNPIESLLNDTSSGIRYAAATALVYFQKSTALPTLKEVLELSDPTESTETTSTPSRGFNSEQIANLKLNIVRALAATEWSELASIVEEAMQNEGNQKVLLYEQQVLNKLKN